jgi:hypothetical protein
MSTVSYWHIWVQDTLWVCATNNTINSGGVFAVKVKIIRRSFAH